MCTKSPHTLLYVDVYRNEIRWCTTGSPVPITCTRATDVRQSAIEDMCIVQHEGRTLIVVADNYEGIFAFNAETGEVDWKFYSDDLSISKEDGEDDEGEEEMYASSITADNRGNLFVCDTNNCCIHAFTTDGEYQGVAFKRGGEGLGKPKRIRWCQTLSSLIIAHQQGNTCSVNIVKLP